MSIPEHAEIVDKDDRNTSITIRSSQISRTIDLYFKTGDMMVPQLLYAESADQSEIACAVSLVPTFDPIKPQDFFEVVKDEKPESIKLGHGSEFHFIFLVDRSGSMGMSRRMPIAIEALTLFLRSLPDGCKFSILSFGNEWRPLNANNHVEDYNDTTKGNAID